eukprot:NODE_1418_length_603_cov_161.016667_g1405_i0.p1 GENE.NODE_1418_length_603_cov_161.016667_g1405_i0~~NODE_1418_length_603_cov_161.016667_g1405_i0.p1  ORF type:complete len:169 (-),score=25.77 NODE_1418_length_603_cov_161.016667_g1405_i0:96-545(-)
MSRLKAAQNASDALDRMEHDMEEYNQKKKDEEDVEEWLRKRQLDKQKIIYPGRREDRTPARTPMMPPPGATPMRPTTGGATPMRPPSGPATPRLGTGGQTPQRGSGGSSPQPMLPPGAKPGAKMIRPPLGVEGVPRKVLQRPKTPRIHF